VAGVGVEGAIVLGAGVVGYRFVGAKFARTGVVVAGSGGGRCRGSQRVWNWCGRK
jgi:hypothetical protein